MRRESMPLDVRRRGTAFAGEFGGWVFCGVKSAVSLVAGGTLWCAAVHGEAGPPVDAHRVVEYRFAVTNRGDEVQWVGDAGVSCGCLRLEVERGAEVEPGDVVEAVVRFDPRGLEGEVERRAWVTLEPSGDREMFVVQETVRQRLGLRPWEAAFGNVQRGVTGREMVAELSGYAAGEAKLGTPWRTGGEDAEGVFEVEVGEAGRSVVARLARADAFPGLYVETWRVPTGDEEIPELEFRVTARVVGDVSVAPTVLDVSADEGGASRTVFLRRMDGEDFEVLGPETEPVRWGSARAERRAPGGWRIVVDGIDTGALGAVAGERPCLVVRTDVSGEEELRIPVRVTAEEGEPR